MRGVPYFLNERMAKVTIGNINGRLVMKRLFLILIVFLTSTNIVDAAAQDVGRYQIISGEYVIIQHNIKTGDVDTAYLPKKVILKLDTVTGETWLLDEENYIFGSNKSTWTRQWIKWERKVTYPDDLPKVPLKK
jgi:hypothetical protein